MGEWGKGRMGEWELNCCENKTVSCLDVIYTSNRFVREVYLPFIFKA